MEDEQYKENIEEMSTSYEDNNAVVKEYEKRQVHFNKRVAKLEQLIKEQDTLIACYQEMTKDYRKNQFMYWFLLKSSAEMILDKEKSTEKKEEFANEVLAAFVEATKGE